LISLSRAGPKILSGVEFGRIFREISSDDSGHGQPPVTVDIYPMVAKKWKKVSKKLAELQGLCLYKVYLPNNRPNPGSYRK
jgi:hypothetical protein